MPSTCVEPITIKGLLLRRAVLGILLAAGRPLTGREIAEALATGGATTSPLLTKGPSRVIADLLAHQARIGKVHKTAPATFEVVPGSMSRSTRQRCLRWQREVERIRTVPVRVSVPAPVPASFGSPRSDDHGGHTHRPKEVTPHAKAAGPDGDDGYPSPMFTVGPATVDDIDTLVEQGAALFREDAGAFDTFIDFTWSAREGRADFERLLADPGCVVLVARLARPSGDTGTAGVGHLVGYVQHSSPTRLPVSYAHLRSLYVAPGQRRRGVADRSRALALLPPQAGGTA